MYICLLWPVIFRRGIKCNGGLLYIGRILVNDQLDALFSMYLFISLLYMFRATQCSSSGESNCIITSGTYHSV